MWKKMVPENKTPAIEVADKMALRAIEQYRREYLINTSSYKLECLK